MTQAPVHRFRSFLEGQGVSTLESEWLASIWVELARRLMAPVGLGAQPEGDRTWIFFHVPQKEEGFRLDLEAIKAMVDPAGELSDLIRQRLLS